MYIEVAQEFNEHFQRVDARVLGIYPKEEDILGGLYVHIPDSDVVDCYIKFHFATPTSQVPCRVQLLKLTEDELCQYDDDEDLHSLEELIEDFARDELDEQ